MPKIPVFNLRPPPPVITSSPEFFDPQQPGQVLQMDLRELDPLEIGEVTAVYEDRVKKYITGGYVENGNTFPQPFPPIIVGDIGVRPTKSAIFNLTYLEFQQAGEDRYEFEELVALVKTMPTAFAAFMDWMDGDARKAELAAKKNRIITIDSPE